MSFTDWDGRKISLAMVAYFCICFMDEPGLQSNFHIQTGPERAFIIIERMDEFDSQLKEVLRELGVNV